MLMTLAATILTAGTLTAQTDTTFSVNPGSRLDVNNFGGQVVVQVWGKNAVRVEATHSNRARIEIDQSGSNIEVRSTVVRMRLPRIERGEHRVVLPAIPMHVDYKITVPAWIAIGLTGVYSDLTVKGTRGDVSAETVKGDVKVNGGDGLIRASSVQGFVTVEGAKGRLQVTSVNEGAIISDIAGDVSVEAVNGDVTLDRINSQMVEASTVNGDVTYLGVVRDGGRYRFSSHRGDLVVHVPEHVSAAISVETFSGDFDSDFPIQFWKEKPGKRSFHFTLGSGSAQIDLETFEGTIALRHGVVMKNKEK